VRSCSAHQTWIFSNNNNLETLYQISLNCQNSNTTVTLYQFGFLIFLKLDSTRAKKRFCQNQFLNLPRTRISITMQSQSVNQSKQSQLIKSQIFNYPNLENSTSTSLMFSLQMLLINVCIFYQIWASFFPLLLDPQQPLRGPSTRHPCPRHVSSEQAWVCPTGLSPGIVLQSSVGFSIISQISTQHPAQTLHVRTST